MSIRLTKLNTKLELIGEGLRGKIKYDFSYEFDSFEALKTVFEKRLLSVKSLKNKLI